MTEPTLELTTAADAVPTPSREGEGPRPWRERLAGAAGHFVAITLVLLLAPIPCLLVKHHGYTWALLIFALPIATILLWFHFTPREELRPVRRAFYTSLGLLVAMGWLLNLFFADDFFVYQNPGAILGPSFPLSLPSFRGGTFTMDPSIPIEEFLFYGSGFVAMLVIYVWACEDFFALYQPANYRARAEQHETIFEFSLLPIVVVGGLVLAATGVKELSRQPGFPGYLVYLLTIPLLTTFLLGRVAVKYINWRALVFMMLVILVDSVLWEVTLALPQGWWRYRPEAMVGLPVPQWYDLPVEAVIVWFLAPFATVVTFEAMKVLWHHPERDVRTHARRAVAKLRRPG